MRSENGPLRTWKTIWRLEKKFQGKFPKFCSGKKSMVYPFCTCRRKTSTKSSQTQLLEPKLGSKHFEARCFDIKRESSLSILEKMRENLDCRSEFPVKKLKLLIPKPILVRPQIVPLVHRPEDHHSWTRLQWPRKLSGRLLFSLVVCILSHQSIFWNVFQQTKIRRKNERKKVTPRKWKKVMLEPPSVLKAHSKHGSLLHEEKTYIHQSFKVFCSQDLNSPKFVCFPFH